MNRKQQPRRNLIHLATGLAAPWVLLTPRTWALAGLGVVLAAAVVLDLLRRRDVWQDRLDRWLPGVYRPEERRTISGATLLAFGYFAAAALMPASAAAAGILALAVGDTAAAVVGRWYGTPRGIAGKTWVGSLACFAASLPAIWAIPPFGAAAATAGAAMAALIESRTGRLDNLLCPLGVAMLLKLWIAGS